MRKVAILAFDHCFASSLTAITDVLRVANQLWIRQQPDAQPLFGWTIVSADGTEVRTSSGLRLAVDGRLPSDVADLVVIPSYHYIDDSSLLRETRRLAEQYGEWLKKQHKEGALISAGCTSAFIIARLGLLDGHEATTSWWVTELFRREFPQVELKSDELIIESNRVICAGPVNSHFNLALRVVETMAGPDLALLCAKTMLVDANRPSQLPYMVMQSQARHTDELVFRAQNWMRNHFREEFSLEDVSRAVGASQRNFIRRFKKALGTTPVEYLQELRVEAAKHLLETTDTNLDSVVERVGYQDVSAFRRLFKRYTTLSPREYRLRFGSQT